VHEGVPGHFFQLSLSRQKLDDLVPENGAGKTMGVGYLSRDSRYAHLLSELIARRY